MVFKTHIFNLCIESFSPLALNEKCTPNPKMQQPVQASVKASETIKGNCLCEVDVFVTFISEVWIKENKYFRIINVVFFAEKSINKGSKKQEWASSVNHYGLIDLPMKLMS